MCIRDRFDTTDPLQGIEHVIAPEHGMILPGMVVLCGDSHTTTYGALGALGFGIGTSEVEHILTTQTLVYRVARNMRIRVDGSLPAGVSAKDLVIYVVHRIGAQGARGHAVEFCGSAIDGLSAEARMTLCNMTVEAGARAALIAPFVTWGTSPDQSMPITGTVPDPQAEPDALARLALEKAVDYIGLQPGAPIAGVPIERVFIGSCTNGRIEDLRVVADIVRGRKVADGVRAMVVPGSGAVRAQAEAEGIAATLVDAGFEWRQPGCSMCLAMNDDVLRPGERCASTTNRNFEGRQGRAGRTHLMSPAMAAAAALAGRIVDVRDLENLQ